MVIRRLHMEIVTAVLTGLFGAAISYGSLELGVGWSESGPEPGYFPFYVGLLIAALSVVNLVRTVVTRRHDEETFVENRHAVRLARFFLPMVAYVVLTILLGLYIGTALYLFYIAWRQGGYRPHVAALIGLGFSVALFIVFDILFKVPLLKGPIEPLLGIY